MPNNFDLSDFALQALAPGNALLYDDLGMPSVMVYIPKFKLSDVLTGGADTYHPAFIVNGTVVDGIYISKYQNVVDRGRAYSIPGKDPASSLTWDTARGYCEAKGAGWHMMTKAEWGAIALWCKKNGTMPYGNNNYGKDTRETLQKAIPATFDAQNRPLHVLTGTGPLAWSHNKEPDGIWDLNGNVSEWGGGIRTVKGELQFLPNNDAADKSNSQTATSAEWKALDATSGQFITPNGSGTTANSVKVNSNSGTPQYAITVTTTSESFSSVLGSVTCTSDIADPAKAVLRAYGLLPEAGDTAYDGDAVYFNNVADERLFYCGGFCDGSASAGVFYAGGYYSRSGSNANVGFRSAFVSLPTA